MKKTKPLLEILAPAHVLVIEREGLWFTRCGNLRRDERAQCTVAVDLEFQGTASGRFQLLGTEVPRETQNAYVRTQRFLGMAPGEPASFHHLYRGGPNERRALLQSLVREFDDGGVLGRSVLAMRRENPAFDRAHVRRHQLLAVENLERVGGSRRTSTVSPISG